MKSTYHQESLPNVLLCSLFQEFYMEFGRSSPCVLSRSISQLLYTPLYPSPQNQAARLSGPLPAFQVFVFQSKIRVTYLKVIFLFDRTYSKKLANPSSLHWHWQWKRLLSIHNKSKMALKPFSRSGVDQWGFYYR